MSDKFLLRARIPFELADMKRVIHWKAASLLCALLTNLTLAIAFWRTRQQLAQREEEKRELEQSSRILEEERHVLQLIARGATLRETLEALTRAVENIVPHVLCSVLLVDQERGCLVQGAAPNLPPQFWEMCDGLPILPDLGCCPIAA